METLISGGPLMIPLGLCAVLAVAFTLERAWVLSRIPSEAQAQATLEEAERVLAQDGIPAAAQHLSGGRGPLNYVLAALLKRFDTLMIARREFQPTSQRLAQLAEEAGAGKLSHYLLQQKELADLKEDLVLETDEAGKAYLGRYLIVLTTVGSISTLLGLFGTILGMIVAFEAIAAAGTGDPKVVAGGIAQALVTTAAGLSIAIPTIVSARYLARKAERGRTRLEIYGLAFVNSLLILSQKEMIASQARGQGAA